MAEGDLQQRLEKLGRNLLKDMEEWETATRGRRREAMQKLTRTVERKIERAFDREARRQSRRERKRQEREERLARQRQQASVLGGLVFFVAALVCAGFAVTQPHLWWMVFVALGLGSAGARQMKLAGEQRTLERAPRGEEAPEAEEEPPAKRHEVDVLCDELLADLAQSPEAVRSFLKEPEKTVASLRNTCHALDERRQQLIAEVPPERLEALKTQRTELLRKRDAATDAEARRKLEEAARSLEAQEETLGRLRQLAERVDGEYTSLRVLLQELRTRVSVARTASTSFQLEGLKQSVQRLNTELEAIAEAMDTVQREGLPVLSEIQPVGEASTDETAEGPRRQGERA